MTSTEQTETPRMTMAQYVAANRITAKVTAMRGVQIKDGWEHRAFRVQLTHGKTMRTMVTDWTQGMGIDTFPEYRPADVFGACVSDATVAIDNVDALEMAGEFGMDLVTAKDRQRARTLFAACQRQHDALVRFLGSADELANVIQNVERD